MENCVFCKIVKGSIPSEKVWENDDFVAILDVNPNTKGMTLVLPKKHYPSYTVELPDDVYQGLMNAAKRVAHHLDHRLGVRRTAMVMEGMGVDHAHIKLYPLHGLGEKFKETWAKEKVFFEKYEGYISTQLGPKADPAVLKDVADTIRTPDSC